MNSFLKRWLDSLRARDQSQRLLPLDALRGLIIVLMALDHASYFVAQQHASERWGGPFPTYRSALPFLTRLVTHLAAPGFFFLMGVGMLLFADARRKQGWSIGAVVGHFVVRGGLLMALQLLVVNRAWELWPEGWGLETYIGVLFALGGTMILGSLLLWLKPRFLLPLTVVLVLGTELLVPDAGAWNQPFHPVHRLLLVPGGNMEFNTNGELLLWVNYPVLPWLELVTFGIVFGHWLKESPRRTFKRTLVLGGAFLVGFLIVRYLDGFGNIRPRTGNGWIPFLNTVKYPPSITFTLFAMGVNLLLVGLLAQTGETLRRFFQPLVVFGQVPLFFYLIHLFLYAGLGLWLAPHGTTLPKMYLYWLLGLAILFPPCWLYGKFKHSRSPNSLWRFL